MSDCPQKKYELVNGRLRIDGLAWFRQLRMDYQRPNCLREMKIGDSLCFGYYRGAMPNAAIVVRLNADIVKLRGGFEATGNFFYAPKPGSRQHISLYAPSLRFKLLPGTIIEFAPGVSEADERVFRLCCRYLNFVFRHSQKYGVPEQDSDSQFRLPLWRGELLNSGNENQFGERGPIEYERTDTLTSGKNFDVPCGDGNS